MKTALFIVFIGSTVICLFCTSAVSQESSGQPPRESSTKEPDWWNTARDVTDLLFVQKKSLVDLVRSMMDTKPQDAHEAMLKINIMMRAGMTKEAKVALEALKELRPKLDNYSVNRIYYTAVDKYRAWEIARSTVEIFADNISELTLENRLLEHFQESGWGVTNIDNWLANMPVGKNNFWIKERFRFSAKHGEEKQLLQQLTEDLKKEPNDVAKAIAFLDAILYARDYAKDYWDPSWIAEICKPTEATEARSLAERLKRTKKWPAAAKVYRLAIAVPLTNEEVNNLAMMCAAFVPEVKLRMGFAATVREELAECLLKMEEKQEAQSLMEEAAEIREKHNLSRNMFFAGIVQGESGARVIEKKIVSEEKEREDNPEYWLERADYYRGRKETNDEENAYKKALQLAKPAFQTSLRRGHRRSNFRAQAISQYARFLKRERRKQDLVLLLNNELDVAPADSYSAQAAARMLAYDFEQLIDPSEEVYWTWLQNNPKWDHPEERFLWEMLQNVNAKELGLYFLRAEKLTEGKDPSRSKALGWIMSRMKFPHRSIPLLKYAIEHSEDKGERESVTCCLFESYLDCSDWKSSEAIFPEAVKCLTAREVPEWYGRIAVVAAKNGAKDEAMRIWQSVANINPGEWNIVRELSKAGLRERLKEYYKNLQKHLPDSDVPRKALRVLAKPVR